MRKKYGVYLKKMVRKLLLFLADVALIPYHIFSRKRGVFKKEVVGFYPL